MREKINQNQQHPEQPVMLVEKLGLEIDKPIALTAEEVEQIQRELGGSTKAHLEALTAYLDNKWNPEAYKERLRQTQGRYTPETYYHVNPNVKIAPNGTVIYKDLQIVMNTPYRNDDKKLWQLVWRPTRGDASYDVRLANDFKTFREWVEHAEKDGQEIPSVVQEKFLQMKSEYEEREAMFEQGSEFVGMFLRTNLETFYSSPTSDEEIELNVRFKKDGDPNDPTSWRINGENCVESVQLVDDQNIQLKFSTGEGDASGGYGGELQGEIIVNIVTNQIVNGTLRDEYGYGDGGYEADYTLNNK